MRSLPHPLASVVIPTFNDPAELRRAIDVARVQTWPAVEIVVVDDGSDVEVEPSIRRWYPGIAGLAVMRHAANRGVLEALASGLGRVSGEFVYLGSTNDPILPGFLETALTQLLRHPQAGLCFFDPGELIGWQDDGRGYPLRLAPVETYFGPDAFADALRRTPFHISSNTAVFRTAALREIGGYRPEFGIYADWFGCFVAAFRTGAVYVPRVLAYSRRHSGAYSARRRWSTADRVRAASRILQAIASEFPDIAPRVRRSLFASAFGPRALLTIYRNPSTRYFFTTEGMAVALVRRAWGIARPLLGGRARRAARSIVASIAAGSRHGR